MKTGEMNMHTNLQRFISLVFVVASFGVATFGVTTAASADDTDGSSCVTHDRTRGECSVGTSAPTREALLNAVKSGSPTRLMATLEYGEHVECDACVVPLVDRILKDNSSEVREFAAWWLRKRPFQVGYAMKTMRGVLASDSDPVRRARAAEAIGEFMDPHGLAHLEDAVENDKVATVRAAAVRGLVRLNHPGGRALIGNAIGDADVDVRLAALKGVRRVNFFDQFDAILGALGDDDVRVRREAALLVGMYRLESAADALGGLLRADEDTSVRQAAAWALGRTGASDARTTLTSALKTETDRGVLDAIEVALKM